MRRELFEANSSLRTRTIELCGIRSLMSNSTSPSEPARVLVVDDEETIRDMLAEFLEMEGYLVETADDGIKALDLLAGDHFDMVLTDLSAGGAVRVRAE